MDAAGFRIGPFGLLDLVGLDVAHAVMKSMHAQYYDEPKYRPSFLSEPRVAAGLLGRKTGRGWYSYGKDGVAEKIPEAAVPSAKPASVWCVPELKELLSKFGAKIEAKPTPDSICFVAPLGHDATTTALQLQLDPERTVAVDPLFGFSQAPHADDDARHEAGSARRGARAARVRRRAGVGDPRLGGIRRAARRRAHRQRRLRHRAAAHRLAGGPRSAVVLGLGYPHGPLAMGDAVGAQQDPRAFSRRCMPSTRNRATARARGCGAARSWAFPF